MCKYASTDVYKRQIYNELEDFTVTQNVKTANIPDAIRKVIGFYPMQMTVGCLLYTSDGKLLKSTVLSLS